MMTTTTKIRMITMKPPMTTTFRRKPRQVLIDLMHLGITKGHTMMSPKITIANLGEVKTSTMKTLSHVKGLGTREIWMIGTGTHQDVMVKDTLSKIEKDGGHMTFHKTTMSSNQAIPLNIAITQDIRIIDIITISIDPQFMQVIEHSAKPRLRGLRTSRSIQGVALSLPLYRMLLIRRAWIGQEVSPLTSQGGSLGITLLWQLHLRRNRSTLG